MIPFTDWNLAQAFCAHQFYAVSSFFITFSDMVPFERRSWLFVIFSTDVKYFLYTVNQYMYRVQRCKGMQMVQVAPLRTTIEFSL